MTDAFIVRALAAGVGIALIAGTLGCFVVWRRMAYFSDSLAHGAFLGIALGLAVDASTNLGTILMCALFAMLLLWLQQQKILATDTLLGILAHAALSFGMVTISLLEQKIDIHSYLFGNILTVTTQELWWIYVGGAVVFFLLLWNWPALLLMTLHEDLAQAEGVRTFYIQALLMFLMAIVVSVSIPVVGILLISSMLIIPPATARHLTRSPEMMAMVAAILGIIAVMGGMYGSILFDTPSGPSIVVFATGLFAFLFFISSLFSR